MRVYLDTGFTGLHKGTTIISIGFVTELGFQFYAEFNDYDKSQVNDWINENVIKNLIFNEAENVSFIRESNIWFGKGNKDVVAKEVRDFLEQLGEVEIWSDCLAYDWVLFNDLFGSAFDIPKNVFYIPFDICTTFKEKGIDPDISREKFSGFEFLKEGTKHNALYDAKCIKKCHEILLEKK